MSSETTYQEIKPIHLYIKQHSITGLKYFGKTTQDPYKYSGSGKHWVRHYRKHGKQHINTLWVSDLYFDTSVVEIALHFSIENNIVESKEWANQKLENGLDGWVPDSKKDPSSIIKQSITCSNRTIVQKAIVSKNCSIAQLNLSTETKIEKIKKYLNTCSNRTSEQKDILGKNISDGLKKYRENITPQQYEKRYANGYSKKTPERKAEVAKIYIDAYNNMPIEQKIDKEIKRLETIKSLPFMFCPICNKSYKHQKRLDTHVNNHS